MKKNQAGAACLEEIFTGSCVWKIWVWGLCVRYEWRGCVLLAKKNANMEEKSVKSRFVL